MAVSSINWNPSRRELQWFAGLLIVFALVVSGLWSFRTGRSTGPMVLLSLLSAIGLLGLLIPNAIRWFYIAWMIAVWPIGWVVSHVLLALIFFGVILPIGVTLRMLGRDPMRKSIDRSAKTYWIDRATEPTDPNRYFRQF